MPRRSFFLITVMATAIQFVISLASFFTSFSLVMDRFDTGGPATFAENVWSVVWTICGFPLFSLPRIFISIGAFFPGRMGYLFFLLNSLIWGLCIAGLVALVLRRRRSLNAKPPTP